LRTTILQSSHSRKERFSSLLPMIIIDLTVMLQMSGW